MTNIGGVAEWSIALVSKTSMLERVSEVRILPPPQNETVQAVFHFAGRALPAAGRGGFEDLVSLKLSMRKFQPQGVLKL